MLVKKYKASDGTEFTDEDIARWVQEVELGFPHSTLEPAQPYEWEHKTQQ